MEDAWNDTKHIAIVFLTTNDCKYTLQSYLWILWILWMDHKKINKKQNMIDDKVWYDMTTTTTKTYKGVCLWIKRCTALSHIWLCNANISYNLTLSQRYKAHKKEHAFDKCSKMKWMKLFDGVRLITHDWTKIYLIFRVTINYTRHYRQNTSIIAMASVHSKVHGANMGPTRVLSDPDGPHVGPMNIAIWVDIQNQIFCSDTYREHHHRGF